MRHRLVRGLAISPVYGIAVFVILNLWLTVR